MDGNSSGSKDPAAGQRKTATLSMTIETINIISRCCSREAKDLERLRSSVEDMRNRVQQMLGARSQPSREQYSGEQGQLQGTG